MKYICMYLYLYIFIYDRAEIWDFIAIFLLPLLCKNTNKNHISLYRDDILIILRSNSCPEAEKLNKNFQKS